MSTEGTQSPRGRGERAHRTGRSRRLRAIPAWAGKTRFWSGTLYRFSGHPRVGGENNAQRLNSLALNGPSPRGRGKPPRRLPRDQLHRAIPAWAGKTSSLLPSSLPPPGHPRVGGENPKKRTRPAPFDGPSPRGRGKPARGHRRQSTRRAIPAWAGKTSPCPWQLPPIPGHPRVGGENAMSRANCVRASGPSPRGRGKLATGGAFGAAIRAIPAWAGKTCQPSAVRRLDSGHPRVGGENQPGLARD